MAALPVPGDETARLRDLHDDYVWRVNAAVGEGREDLIADLVEDYADEALRLMSAYHPSACARPGCAVCDVRTQLSRPSSPPARRGVWKFLLGR